MDLISLPSPQLSLYPAPTLSPLRRKFFLIVNGVPFHAAFHYHPPIVLIWLKYSWKKNVRSQVIHPSIKFIWSHFENRVLLMPMLQDATRRLANSLCQPSSKWVPFPNHNPLHFDRLETWYVYIYLCRSCYFVADYYWRNAEGYRKNKARLSFAVPKIPPAPLRLLGYGKPLPYLSSPQRCSVQCGSRHYSADYIFWSFGIIEFL